MAGYLRKHKEIVKYIHHGTEVNTFAVTKGYHREFCLCHNHCRFFKPEEKDNCSIAQELYEFDVRNHVTTPVLECPIFEKGDLITF